MGPAPKEPDTGQCQARQHGQARAPSGIRRNGVIQREPVLRAIALLAPRVDPGIGGNQRVYQIPLNPGWWVFINDSRCGPAATAGNLAAALIRIVPTPALISRNGGSRTPVSRMGAGRPSTSSVTEDSTVRA